MSGTALAAGETRNCIVSSPAASAVPLSKVSAIGRTFNVALDSGLIDS